MSKRGYTLAELLVVMGMTGVVFTLVLGMVHRVMHEQRFADRDNVMHRIAERLSTRLREDIHFAISAEMSQSDSEQRLALRQPEERLVTYTVRESVLEREATQQDEPTHRDSFELPDNYRLEFSVAAAERVSFTVYAVPQAHLTTKSAESEAVASESDVRRAVTHLEASVGRDHRFSTEAKETE